MTLRQHLRRTLYAASSNSTSESMPRVTAARQVRCCDVRRCAEGLNSLAKMEVRHGAHADAPPGTSSEVKEFLDVFTRAV